MPIQPIVGREYECLNGNKASVKMRLDKPDVHGVLFVGSVRLNGDDQMAGWRNNGVCPANEQFTLDSLWPIDDSRQYTVIKRMDDGVYRSMCTYYAELGSLKHDNPDAKYALKLERDNQGLPTCELINLEQVE